MSLSPNKQPFLVHLQEMLLRFHRFLGLTHEDYVLLNTCIQYEDLDTVEEITGMHEDEVLERLEILAQKNIIYFDDENEIDLRSLYDTLKQVEKTMIPIRELLITEIKNQKVNPHQKHLGHVELVPMKKGIAVRMNNGFFLSVRQTKELGRELMDFAEATREEDLQRMNFNIQKDKN